MGTSTAYQMAKAGLDVVLCEMRNLGSGATGRCGGMVVHCYGRETNIDKAAERLKFQRANTEMLKAFQQELEIDYEFRQVGCLDIASSESEASELKDLVDIQRSQGDFEIELLDKKETLEIMPTLNPELVFGSRWRPSDGNLAPYKMCASFGWGAKKYGARVLTHTKVNKILIENDKVKGVETDKGVILSKWVLNATNAWSKYLSKEAECVLPVREIACVTEAIGPSPAMAFEMLLEGEFSYGGTQTASGNLTIGGPAHPRDRRIGYYNEMISINEIQRLGHYLNVIFPKQKDLKIIRAWTGTMGFSPDGMPLVGSSSLTEGLLIAAGFAAGISQECTVGKIMTELVTKGGISLDIDLSLYAPGRFVDKHFEWPDPYDLSVLHDYLAYKKRGKENEYKLPYDLVNER